MGNGQRLSLQLQATPMAGRNALSNILIAMVKDYDGTKENY